MEATNVVLVADPEHAIMFSWKPRHATRCRIVDVIATNTGDEYFVDDVKVPPNATVMNSLRRAEASSPCTCLRLFVPTSVKLQDVEDMRVITAGKMQYVEFHAYIYDQHCDWVQEIVWQTIDAAKVRSGAEGILSWPDRQPRRK